MSVSSIPRLHVSVRESLREHLRACVRPCSVCMKSGAAPMSCPTVTASRCAFCSSLCLSLRIVSFYPSLPRSGNAMFSSPSLSIVLFSLFLSLSLPACLPPCSLHRVPPCPHGGHHTCETLARRPPALTYICLCLQTMLLKVLAIN